MLSISTLCLALCSDGFCFVLPIWRAHYALGARHPNSVPGTFPLGSAACCLMSVLALCGIAPALFLLPEAQHSIFVLGAWQWSPQHRSARLASFCHVYLFNGSSVLEHFVRFSARRRGADIAGIGAPSACCALGSGVLHFCSARLASACSPKLFKG